MSSCIGEGPGMKIVFTGDVILDRGVNDELKLHGDSILINAFKCIKESDFLFVNYEGTLTESDSIQNDLYNFKADEGKAFILKQAGVTHVSIANNHIYDFGPEGFFSTIDALNKSNLVAVGRTCEPIIVSKGKYKCAVLSASLTSNQGAICGSTIEQLKNNVSAFSSENDIPLILYVHWGLEFQPMPEEWQRQLASDLVDLGVDAIIGHHPHVVQMIEYIGDCPVFYSIGNYIADAYLPETTQAYTVELIVSRRTVEFQIQPVRIDRYFPRVAEKKEQFHLVNNYLSYSDNVCAYQQDASWQIKHIANVNFQESSSHWLLSGNGITASVKRLQNGTQLLTYYTPQEKSNTVSIHGELSEIQLSDIDNNGSVDILLGLRKRVHFDPHYKKRINIYSYQNFNLQPLWLGTKFIYDLESFNVQTLDNLNFLSTMEVDKKGIKYQGVYEWDDFGFALTTLNQVYDYEN